MESVKLSQFTVFVEDYPQTGHHLAYNTLSRALVEVDSQCLSMLYSLGNGGPPISANPVLQDLQTQGILVPMELNEVASYHEEFSTRRKNANQLHATILTTFQCPMRCIYCYQKHIKNGGHMSTETMEKTVSWLEDQILRLETKRCQITFYGGEPLANPTPIEYIGTRMGKYCKDKGIRLYLAMATSSILLTPELAKKLKGIGLKYLQITLDGDRDAHDKRRMKKDGSGTFDLIMGNLIYLIKDFSITITCNVDRTNVLAAHSLIDILHSQGYAGKIEKFVFGAVSAPSESAQGQRVACPETNDEDLVSLILHAASKGFVSDLRPRHKLCGMLQPGLLIVDPDGKLYTCPSFLGSERYRAGAIDESENIGVRELIDFDLQEKCLQCAYVPICTGGCRYDAFVEQGDIRATDCQRGLLSHSLPLLLKAHYALRNKE